ncbi:hypothetical protein B0H63DRAFT_467816 [Podospora didyma]|uniref:Fungal N-terminal domain-containing protein n=1 Tax=Podospora didyma TaxID=330526 RepID=A0AAE0U0J9_9PEZI|nr:hypothetical protein B0H63DRAFT_467816 [Podospora didyma]
MEPISAAASVLGVVSAIASVTSTATRFMRDVRSARKEIVAVKKELSSLSAVLEILADDFNDPANTSFPDAVLTQIVEISTDCRRVVTEIGDCFRSQQGSRLNWASSGKGTIEKLRADLETHKSTLSVTLDLVSVIVLRDIKNDTEQIRQDTSVIRQDTGQIQDDMGRVLEELSRLRVQLSAVENDQRPSGYMLQRFLSDLRTEAETVLGDADHLANQTSGQDEDSNNEGSVSDDNLRPSSPTNPAAFFAPPGRQPDTGVAPVMFTNTQGRRYPIPFAACKTWADMSKLIRESFAHSSEETRGVIDGSYDLIGPNGEIILKTLWESLVKPGWEVSMKMWESGPMVKFKDCTGQKFGFPLQLCRTWQDMEILIKEIFTHNSIMRPIVQQGYYELLESNDRVILPERWETVIWPGIAVWMRTSPSSYNGGNPSMLPPESRDFITLLHGTPPRGSSPLPTLPQQPRSRALRTLQQEVAQNSLPPQPTGSPPPYARNPSPLQSPRFPNDGRQPETPAPAARQDRGEEQRAQRRRDNHREPRARDRDRDQSPQRGEDRRSSKKDAGGSSTKRSAAGRPKGSNKDILFNQLLGGGGALFYRPPPPTK